MPDNLRSKLNISGLLLMYVGNLEAYQGIALLLESFALVLKLNRVDLVIIGGETSDIEKYQKQACDLKIDRQVHFLASKPVEDLGAYLSQADILVSPRIKGKNTPMKIYSYLDSGKAVLATSLPTHTQILNSQVAMLAEPSAEKFSKAMLCLMKDETLRQKLGKAGKKLIEENFSYAAFNKRLNDLFDWLQTEIEQEYNLVVNTAVSPKPQVRS
ncbi:MAG TPA: glycoside hydrolase [Cyanobacteria bacterium UBA11049]|nr:glycoside hydrolase [Cyanobacteria bacterium UBA11049]